jgi:hypothetical protein
VSLSGYLYIGGKFTNDSAALFTCPNIAVMDYYENVFSIDNSSGSGYGFDAAVNFIKEDTNNPNYFIIGGEFNNFNIASSSYYPNKNVIWQSNGAYDTAAIPYEVVYMNIEPLSITQNGSDFYIGGAFTGLPYGDYLTNFRWDGSLYQVVSNPYGASPSSPLVVVYQGPGIWWSDTTGALYEANTFIAYTPFGGQWNWISNTVWGQVIFSTNSPSQNPIVAYYLDSSDVITLSLTVGTIYSGVTPFTGGIILYARGAVVEMIYQVSTDRWYVITANNAGFF